jgi:hypothetical protein
MVSLFIEESQEEEEDIEKVKFISPPFSVDKLRAQKLQKNARSSATAKGKQ